MAKKKEAVKTAEDRQVQDYELVYIVSPEVADEALEVVVNNISQFITGKDGVVAEVERWGKRKLAYPVGRFLEGNYVLTRFKISPAWCKELEANLNISEEVLRHVGKIGQLSLRNDHLQRCVGRLEEDAESE